MIMRSCVLGCGFRPCVVLYFRITRLYIVIVNTLYLRYGSDWVTFAINRRYILHDFFHKELTDVSIIMALPETLGMAVFLS